MNESADPNELINSFIISINNFEILKEELIYVKSNLANNYLVYETLFWAFEILREEKNHNSINLDNAEFDELVKYLIAGEEYFSTENPLFYKTMNDRYKYVANYFERKFNINFDLYLQTGSQEKLVKKQIEFELFSEIEKLKTYRINKPEPSSETIEDICKKINRKKFQIRPTYQRREVINRKKSSSLIESILLGIKVPPIFIYKRTDGIFEVVDGQQRLLSIIGFIGEEFLNENGVLTKSNKNLYKLTDLRVLTNLNNSCFTDLEQSYKDKILDFNIPIVTIEEAMNSDFDPIDLFIRLNNKPYPIRENSFEMWNSYIDKAFIESVKKNVKLHSGWFYLRSPERNARMDNELCYTFLIFLFYKWRITLGTDHIKFYQRGDAINARLKDKYEITNTLENLSKSQKIKDEFDRCINDVENFINLIKNILMPNSDSPSSDYLRHEFGDLMNLKSNRRTMQGFYLLWHILHNVNQKKVSIDYSKTKIQIKNIFALTKNIGENDSLPAFFNEVELFTGAYSDS